jgi:hypothetical protein
MPIRVARMEFDILPALKGGEDVEGSRSTWRRRPVPRTWLLPGGSQGGDQADAHAAVLIAFSDGLHPDVARG